MVYQHNGRSSLYIKLAERLIRIESGIESYLKRPPFIDDLHFADEHGKPLNFKVSTSPEILQFQTEIGEFQLTFHNKDTLAFRFPDNKKSKLCFRVRSTHWHAAKDTGGQLSHVKDIAFEVQNGRIIESQRQESQDGQLIEITIEAEKDCALTLRIAENANLLQGTLPFSKIYREAQQRWEKWFESAPPVGEKYRAKYAYAWWIMANNLIHANGYVKYDAMMPTKAFYVGIWLWDSALHAIAYRHIDPELARNQIRAMLAHQLPDGMLPDVVFDEGIVTEIDHPIHGRVTKPPIMAWSALKIHETDPNTDFLREIYEPLVHWNRWWFEQNDDDKDGIVQYTHPYSSGLDDNPLWDTGMPVESPDINTYLYIQMMSLAKIARILENQTDATTWETRAEELLSRMIDQLWDHESHLFVAKHNHKSIPTRTPFNLYPLWTGKLPDEIEKHLLKHLKDLDQFWGEFGIPTVAFNDPAFNPDKMWRGPVWANINYFFIEALVTVGQYKLANELRIKTLDLIASQPDIREYYNPQTGIAPTSAAPTFGWSAAVFIDLVLMNIPNERNAI